MSDVFFAGVGAYLPPVVPVAEAIRRGWCQEAEGGGWLGAAVAGDIPAPELAVRAGREALARSGHAPSDVALVVHASTLHQGPDGWAPAQYVQRHTVGGHAPALEIRQGCNGMLGAVELARGFLGPGRTAALITGADNFGTALVDRWRYAAGAGTNRPSILGDAGTALVLSTRDGFGRLLAIASMSLPELEGMYREGVPLFPPPATTGTPMRLGAALAAYAARRPGEFAAAKEELSRARTELAERTLAEAGVPAEKVTRVTHVFAGDERYVRAVLGPLGIDPAAGMLEYGRTVGHLGAGDHVAALNHLIETDRLGPGDHVLMLSNGVGVSLSCAVLEIVRSPRRAEFDYAG